MEIRRESLINSLKAANSVVAAKLASPAMSMVRLTKDGRVTGSNGVVTRIRVIKEVDCDCLVDAGPIIKALGYMKGDVIQGGVDSKKHVLVLSDGSRELEFPTTDIKEYPDVACDHAKIVDSAEDEWNPIPECGEIDFYDALELAVRFTADPKRNARLGAVKIGTTIEATDGFKMISVAVTNFEKGKSLNAVIPAQTIKLMSGGSAMAVGGWQKIGTNIVFRSKSTNQFIVSATQGSKFPSIDPLIGDIKKLTYVGDWDPATVAGMFEMFQHMTGSDEGVPLLLSFDKGNLTATQVSNRGKANDAAMLSANDERGKIGSGNIRIHSKHVVDAAGVCESVYLNGKERMVLFSEDDSIKAIVALMRDGSAETEESK